MKKNFSYIEKISNYLDIATQGDEPVFIYGENIDNGSRISGLASNLIGTSTRIIQNVGNCELTHCGIGFGIMIDGGNAVLYVKQLDFVLLGLDQICNTYNYIRAYVDPKFWGSFTIVAIVCDQGYQGAQSSFNNPGDLSSLAGIPVYCLNSGVDIAKVIQSQLIKPGFRIICISQNNFKYIIPEVSTIYTDSDNGIFKYRDGGNVTIVSYNFSLNKAIELSEYLDLQGLGSDVFHVNFIPNLDMGAIIESTKKTQKLIIIDSSRGIIKFGDELLSSQEIRSLQPDALMLTRRGRNNSELQEVSENMVIDNLMVLRFVLGSTIE